MSFNLIKLIIFLFIKLIFENNKPLSKNNKLIFNDNKLILKNNKLMLKNNKLILINIKNLFSIFFDKILELDLNLLNIFSKKNNQFK